MHKLPDTPSPTVTIPSRTFSVPRTVALYTTFAFSITAASTALSVDYKRQLSLKPASISDASATNTTLLEQQIEIVSPKTSWLEGTISALMADFTDEELARIPDKFVSQIDKNM